GRPGPVHRAAGAGGAQSGRRHASPPIGPELEAIILPQRRSVNSRPRAFSLSQRHPSRDREGVPFRDRVLAPSRSRLSSRGTMKRPYSRPRSNLASDAGSELPMIHPAGLRRPPQAQLAKREPFREGLLGGGHDLPDHPVLVGTFALPVAGGHRD